MFCIETLPVFKEKHYVVKRDGNGIVLSKTYEGEKTKVVYKPVFFHIEAACIAWFTLEYILRLIVSSQKLNFMYQPLNLIDVVAVLPFYVMLGLEATDYDISILSVLRVLRLVRVFRIFKLSRYSKGLKILGYTFRVSYASLFLFHIRSHILTTYRTQ